MDYSRLIEPLRSFTGQLNTKRIGPVTNFNNNIKFYKSTFNIHNDKQTKKRTAEDSSQSIVPAKKINITSTNSCRTVQLRCNEKFNTQVSKYVTTIKELDKYIDNENANTFYNQQINSKNSNTADNFTGSFYLKYYDNINENVHQNEFHLQHNERVSDYTSLSISTIYKPIQLNNVTNNVSYKHFTNPKPMKNTNVTKVINNLTVHQRLGPKIKENWNNIDKSQINNINKKRSALLRRNNSEYSNILDPNVPPTAKMQKSMADALEAIEYITSKAILNQPNANNSDVKLFMSSFKTIISQRIEEVLTGHPVRSRSDIIDRYLERYPTEKDTELKEGFKDLNDETVHMILGMETCEAINSKLLKKTQRGDKKNNVLPNNDLEKRIIEAFEVFDHSGKQVVDVREIGTILRSLGCCPTEAEVQEVILATESKEATGNVPLASFLRYMVKAMTEHKFYPATADALLAAFKFFDEEGVGYLPKEKFLQLMTQEGEPFTQEEVDEMMQVALDAVTDQIAYEFYINQLMVEDEVMVTEASTK